jgi:hypothetical protein
MCSGLASGNPGDNGFGGIAHLFGYMDDISSCIYLPNLKYLSNTMKYCSDKVGCFINPSKRQILTSCNGTLPLLLLQAINFSLSPAIFSKVAIFSTTPHPTYKNGPTTPVELTTGFRLLGHPIGTTLFARDFFQTFLTMVNSNI